MNNDAMERICKIIQKLTFMVGIVSIALPIVFLGSIPDTIPSHYNIYGEADRFSGKESIIFLLIVAALLMGAMAIALFGVKTSMQGKHASEYDTSSLNIVYIILTFVNFSIQCMFAYIIYCSASGNNLGSITIFIFLALVLGPLLFMILKNVRNRSMAEKQALSVEGEGLLYRSKVDWWLAAILLFAVGSVAAAVFEPVLNGKGLDVGTMIPLVIVGAVLLPLFSIKYVLYEDHLLVNCGYLGKTRIKYSAIRNVKETRNPLSSAALSLDRIQIDYVVNRSYNMVLISPVRKQEFLKLLEEFREKSAGIESETRN